jgi:membrane-bound serine protease (ClpP class)
MARTTAAAAGPQVVVLELHDTIQPASLRYIERGLRQAASAHAALAVIELDTPGGLLVSLRSMTSAILASPVPVVAYVTPSGARAASAGFFLLL